MKKLVALLFALAPLAFSADEIAWGPSVGGMRLGIVADREVKPPILRVFIENSTSLPQDLLVKTATNLYAISLYGISPDGKQYSIYDSVWGNMPFGGAGSEHAKVEPGARYEFRLRLDEPLANQNLSRLPITLDQVLAVGYAIHASYDELVSGELKGPSR